MACHLLETVCENYLPSPIVVGIQLEKGNLLVQMYHLSFFIFGRVESLPSASQEVQWVGGTDLPSNSYWANETPSSM